MRTVKVIGVSVDPDILTAFDRARGPMPRSTLISLLIQRETQAIKERGSVL